MEPPPFHHHHNNTRYVHIVSPRFSGDRNFYHHHLPPPPPPPPTQPPLPTLYHPHPHHQPHPHPHPQPHPHPSQFPFPNSHQIIEGVPRRQHPFLVERPPRAPVTDRIIYDQHHRTPVPDDHPHLPDAWDPPPARVTPQIPRTFPGGWENESPRNHLSAHPMSPYRSARDGNFIERKRFVDDRESGPLREYPIDGFERKQNDEFFYDQSDNRVSTSGSSHGNYFRNRISFENTVSSRNHAQSAGNKGMNFDFESENGRSWDSRGAGDGTNEGRTWVSARPNSRDASSFVRGIEMEDKEIMGEDDIRVVSGKRFPYTTKMGKFNNRVGNEGSQEIIHTPKRKPQKLSALQRIQLGNATPRKFNSSAAYFDESNSGSFRSKGPLVFSDKKFEEERVGSPVELDVSFKSNALVAKQVMAPSSPVVGAEGSSTPKTKRIKKVIRPVSVSSSSCLTEYQEGPISGDGSLRGVDDASNSDKGPMQLEEKSTVSGTGMMDDAGSQPCPSGVNLSMGKRAKEGSSGAMTSTKDRTDVNVSHEGKGTARIKKKRKIVSSHSSLSCSQASEIRKEPINADKSSSSRDATLSSGKDRFWSEEKIGICAVKAIENVDLQPCPNVATVSLEKDAVQGSAVAMVSEKEDIKVVSDVEVAPNVEKIKEDRGPFPGLSSSQVSEIHEGPVNTNGSLCDADVNLVAAKNPSHLDGRGTVSDAMPVNDVVLRGLTVGHTLENSVVEVSPEARIEMIGNANCVSDGTCRPKSSEKTKINSPPPVCLSSRPSESHEKPVNEDSLMHCVDAVSSADRVSVESAEKVPISGTGTRDDVGKEFCPCVGVSLGNSAVKGSLEDTNMVRDVLTVESKGVSTSKRKRKRKVQVSKIHEGHINRNSSNNSEDPTSSLDNVPSRFKEKSTVSDIGSMGNVALLSCPNGISVTGEITTVKVSPKAVNSAKSVLNVDFVGMCVPNIRRQREGLDSLLDLSSSQASDMHGEALNIDSSIHDWNTTTVSENVPVCSEQKDTVSCIGYVDSVASQPCPNEVSVLLEHSSVKEFPKVIDSVIEGSSEGITKPDHPNADSSSSVGESAVLNLQFPCLSGSRDDHPGNAIPGVAMTSCQECPRKDDILGQESVRGRQEQTEEGASEVACMLGIENSKDTSVLHPPAQGQPGAVPSDIQTFCLDESPRRAAMDGNASNRILKDLWPCASDYLSLSVGIITDSNGEQMKSVPGRISKIESPESLSEVKEICILNTEQSLTNIFKEKIHRDDHKPDVKSIVKDASTLTADKLCVLPDVNRRSDKNMHTDGSITEKGALLSSQGLTSGKNVHTDGSITEKGALLSSQGIRQPSPNPKLMVGELHGKKISRATGVPRGFQGRSSLVSSSFKKTAPSTHITNSRTWQRTDNPSSSLAGKKSSSNVSPSQRQSPKKLGKVQSTSYIRKGNSLVRKGAPNAAFPQGSRNLSTTVNPLSAMGGDKTQKITASECKGIRGDPLSSRKGGANPYFESPKTPPLPQSSKLQNSTTKSSTDIVYHSSNDPFTEGGSEATPDSTEVTENEDASKHAKTSENQASLNNNFGIQGILKDGNLQSSKMNIVYVKHKSNQLIASSPGIRDPSINAPEKTQALSSSISSDCYYKRNKNQLIRNIQIPGSQLRQSVAIHDDSSNSEGQRVSTVPSLKCSRSLSKRRPHKGLGKTCKSSKFSLVWTLHGTNSKDEDKKALQCQKVWPYLFPWKRMASWKHCRYDSVSMSNRSSISHVRKLLLSRKRDTVYTRSTGGFSLRKSKVLSIGGSNLKWSKSIEKRSKKVNEEATLAVAAAERKKREQKGAACAIASAKNRNQSSRKSGHTIELRPGERVFRIGSVRYKMDPSKRTLQRIADEKSGAVDPQSGNNTRKAVVPRRLLIGNDEYVRIGNGHQLIRDPKKLIRFLASEKIRWSLHTARLRLARKQQYCQFFTRFGKCNKDDGKCPYVHDPTKVAVCTKFLKGLCDDTNCKLTHKVIPERMQDCSYFLQGLCTNENCPYRHVNVNPSAPVCERFLRGYCVEGDECRKKHSYVCPVFEATGICPQGSTCKLHHPKNQNKGKKRKRSKDQKNKRVRYFGSRLTDATESSTVASNKPAVQNHTDIFFQEGHFVDYISLDISDEEAGETTHLTDMNTSLCDSDPSEVAPDDIGDLIKPVRILNRNLT